MRKIVLSIALVLIFGVFVLFQNQNLEQSTATPTKTEALTSPTPIILPVAPSENTSFVKSAPIIIKPPKRPRPQTEQNTSSVSNYKDGTYSGPVTDAFFGNLQVAAVIRNGKLSDVQALQFPNDRPTSIQINSSALPKLTSEAIQVQSANVDIVSGATQTSQAFQQSLKAALLAARS